VQNGAGGAFARTLHLEAPEVTCCVIDVPTGHPMAPKWAVQEALAASGYSEVHYDREGIRRTPVLKAVRPEVSPVWSDGLGSRDVLLVTGGGKGIGAECALHLARETGVRLALLGRSRPETDLSLSSNLQRIAGSGAAFQYFSADVTDHESVRDAVHAAEKALGPVTSVLHSAGNNTPQLITGLEIDAFQRTLKPKLDGLRNVLAAIQPERLRLLITFGSLIARTGLPGEADYGMANEWLRRYLEEWHEKHPMCRCLHLDWSVWAGVGMGERLSRLRTLTQQGITPIPVDEGLRILHELIKRDVHDTSLVIAGRFGDPPTISLEQPELPFLRFLEHVRTHVPGVELIADSELSTESDPYLNEHVYEGERLVPAVIGLEAMAQVVMPLLNTKTPPEFEEVKFQEAIPIPAGGAITLRVAALVTKPGRCRVVLRSSTTAFQIDHFCATCTVMGDTRRHDESWTPGEAGMLPLAAEKDLYGKLLFHSGRFRRLYGYHLLRAKECIAEITAAVSCDWFWRYLPGELVLGDPAVRDTAIHAIQCCIPQSSLLPFAVRHISTARLPGVDAGFVHAKERESDGETFVYDVEITDSHGTVLEQWAGLRLRRMKDVALDGTLPAPLLGPLLERRIVSLVPGWEATVIVEPADGRDRRAQSEVAVRRATGISRRVVRRPDGKPEIVGSKLHVSASHSADLIVAVAGTKVVSCDAEQVVRKPKSVWLDLLGVDRFTLAELIAQRTQVGFDIAATHVWTATECLAKAGAIPGSPLVLDTCDQPGALLFACGSRRIATFEVAGNARVRVFAFLNSAESVLCERSSFATL
jgi:enediyne polyketide synthase